MTNRMDRIVTEALSLPVHERVVLVVRPLTFPTRHKRSNVLHKVLGTGNPWTDALLVETDQVHIVAFLTSLEEIVIGLRQLLRDFTRLHEVAIE